MKYLFKLTKRIAAARTRAFLLAATLVACATNGDVVTAPSSPSTPAATDNRVASVSVTPTLVSGNLGDSGQLTAIARNAEGTVLSNQQFTWVATDPTIVSVASSGAISAVGVGAAVVTASAGGIAAQAQVTVAGEAIAAVTLSPGETAADVGQVAQFHATLMGAAGSVLSGRPVVWTTDDSTVATVDTTGRTTQVGPGKATITASSAGQKGFAYVTVGNTAPGNVTTVLVTATTDSSATLSFGQVDDGTNHPAGYIVRYAPGPFAWSTATEVSKGTCTSPLMGTATSGPLTCSVRGLIPATTYGFAVEGYRGVRGPTALYGGISPVVLGTTAASQVTPPPPPQVTLTQLVLTPTTITLNPAGAAQFAVSGVWSDGSVAVPAVTYSATGGTISATGLYTAGATPGTFHVIATQQGGTKADTSSVTISVPVATLLQLVLTPVSIALATGGTAQFVVAGVWSDGSSTIPAVSYVATGGTISAGGLYTAGAAPGAFRIIATQQGGSKADTSTVTISTPAPMITKLTLSPKSSALPANGTVQFTVSAMWSDGTVTVPAATYAATGGTVTTSGSYTAGLAPGAFRAIATLQGGTKADTALITVSAPPAVSLALVVQPGGSISGTPFTQQPVVELRSSQNQPVLQGSVVVTASMVTGTGTLAGPLSATTNTQGRAVFSGLQITGSGDHTLAFTAVGLIQAISQTVPVGLPSLRALASARNFRMGTAVNANALAAGGAYAATLAAQYNSVIPENVMKFGIVHPGPSQYTFTSADQLVSFAQANGMVIQATTLVWGEGIPTWVTSGSFTKAQLLALVKDHITTVVGHFAGKLASWDVVNEAVAWDGTLLPTFWTANIGPEVIDSAFVWAHRADPAAKLYYNDYNTEVRNPKSDGILTLVQGLRARGVPIDGVGFQSHIYSFETQTPPPTAISIQANFARFANAGFDFRVSEMDVMLPDTAGSAALITQSVVFRDILDACLLQSRCTGFTTWGFVDLYSWIPNNFAGFGRGLPFDATYRSKPAFDSLAARLRRP